MINKKKIRKNFTNCATSYDRYARLQQRVAEEVVKRVKALGIRPTHILDIGSGTGFIALALKKVFGSASIQACDSAYGMVLVARAKGADLFRGNSPVFIGADAEFLPYKGRIFDLVVSSLAYQWLPECRCAFREAFRVLRPEGTFLFATLGGKTLFELRNSYLLSYRESGNGNVPSTLHDFIERDAVQNMLFDEGFSDVYVESRFEREYHRDVKDLLLSLRAIGAQNAILHSPRGLGRPRLFKRMMDIYEYRHGSDLHIPATYELVFASARKLPR